jgi:hypothetical protein
MHAKKYFLEFCCMKIRCDFVFYIWETWLYVWKQNFFLYIFFCYISEKTGHFNTRFYIFIVQKYQPILTRMVEKYARKSQIFWKDFENFMKFPLLTFLIYIYIIIMDWVRVQPNYMGWAQPDEAKPSPKRRWAMTDPKKKRHRATMSL